MHDEGQMVSCAFLLIKSPETLREQRNTCIFAVIVHVPNRRHQRGESRVARQLRLCA